jgi:hypothetical protein
MSEATKDLAVKDNTDEATPARVVTLDLLKAAVERREQEAVYEHYDADLDAVFKLRVINGAELDRVLGLAKGDDTKYRQFLINAASVEPKIDMVAWAQLQQLAPRIRTRLINTIVERSGLAPEAVEDAKNSSGETVAAN